MAVIDFDDYNNHDYRVLDLSNKVYVNISALNLKLMK